MDEKVKEMKDKVWMCNSNFINGEWKIEQNNIWKADQEFSRPEER